MRYPDPKARLAAAALAVALVPAQAAAADYEARIGHLESPEQSRHIYLEKVADMVSERTDGAVEFQIFPSSQLGNQRQMTEGVQLGSIEGTVAPAAFLGGFNPAVSILDIPFLMPEDRDATQKLREGPFGDALLDTFASRGMTAIALWPNGRKHFTSNKPLDDLAAFEDQKFRVMDSKILIEQFEALDASAVALPFGELYTALQTGVVDGEENPLDTIRRMKFYEVQDHLVLSGHGAMEDVVLFNTAWWQSLPEEYREIIDETFDEVIPALRKDQAGAIDDALSVIEQSDTTVREMSGEEKAAMRKKIYPAARAAYLDRAGDEGKELISIYERELDKVTE